MKIIYNSDSISEDISKLASSISAESLKVPTLEESIDELKKSSGGKSIGIPIPTAYIDLGKYLVTFLLGILVDGVVYDVVWKKFVLENISGLIKKTDGKYKQFIISDGNDSARFETNVYFFIPLDLSAEELKDAFDKIEEILKITSDLKKKAKVLGSLRFYYHSGDFLLQEICVSKN